MQDLCGECQSRNVENARPIEHWSDDSVPCSGQKSQNCLKPLTHCLRLDEGSWETFFALQCIHGFTTDCCTRILMDGFQLPRMVQLLLHSIWQLCPFLHKEIVRLAHSLL